MLDTTPSAIDEIPAADQPPVPAPVVPAKRKGPGALRGEVSLTLDTRQAVNLFNGRPKVEDGPHPIPGLYRFARCLDQIAVGGGAEDPYADWAIMRIEKLMTACEQLFTDLEADVAEQAGERSWDKDRGREFDRSDRRRSSTDLPLRSLGCPADRPI